jgi:hypothetical protein
MKTMKKRQRKVGAYSMEGDKQTLGFIAGI